MGETKVGVTDVAAGAGVVDYRVRSRTVGGATVAEQYVVPILESVPSAKALASTFRIVGVSGASQHLASLFNNAGSGVLVAVRYVVLHEEFVSTSASVRWAGAFSLAASPTGGTVMTPTLTDSAGSHSASVEFRGAASADGTANAITATPGNRWRGGFYWHAPTDVGQRTINMHDQPQKAPPLIAPLERLGRQSLAEGEGLLVEAIQTGSANTHFIVNIAWEEYTLP